MSATKRVAIVGVVLSAIAAVLPGGAFAGRPAPAVRVLAIRYRAHDGLSRRAYLILPAWYGPKKHPPIPLVISPHGRGVGARANIRRWGDLAAHGGFAVINPEGQGRRLTLFSWGDPGEIRDLARMPRIAERAVPWLQIERHRVYAFGGSMGGQETLLLLARFPRLLAGAAAFDAPTNMAARYRAFELLPFGDGLQRLARRHGVLGELGLMRPVERPDTEVHDADAEAAGIDTRTAPGRHLRQRAQAEPFHRHITAPSCQGGSRRSRAASPAVYTPRTVCNPQVIKSRYPLPATHAATRDSPS
jgi:pimeloyl-ACP methyl ester carboxylesterase